MQQNINAEIISIGTEIILGELTDTNSVHIARAMRDIGVNVFYITAVGDNRQRIATAIQAALTRSDVVITTGGLGPTVDDMTRQAVADATGRDLVFHQTLLDSIAERFTGFGMKMTENNRQQAYLPADAIPVQNPVGTAPAYIVEYEGRLVISLPGVPREMKFLLAERIIPFLRERYQLGIIKARILRTAGIGESALDDLLGKELLEAGNPTVGLAAHSGIVDVRITAKADTVDAADEMIAVTEAKVRETVGRFIYGLDKDTIEDALAKTLSEQGKTLAVGEVGVNEVIHPRWPASDLLIHQVQFDSPAALLENYEITETPSLREQAVLLAERLTQESGATIGIAIVSDPHKAEDHADSDEGTAVAVYMNGKSHVRGYGFGGQVELARSWTSIWALARAWMLLQEDA